MQTIVIAVGGLLILVGALGIAGQVRVHRIDPRRWPAWLFRIGALTLVVGQGLAGAANNLGLVVETVMIGLALLALSALMVGHEWRQAGEQRDPTFRLTSNGPMRALLLLRVSLVGAALLLIGGLALQRLTDPLRLLIILVVMFNLAALYALGAFIAPEWRRSGFTLGRSLSLQVFVAGMVVAVAGVLAWAGAS